MTQKKRSVVLSMHDMVDVLRGGAILGSGGGGHFVEGEGYLKKIENKAEGCKHPVRLVGVNDIDETDYVASPCLIGSSVDRVSTNLNENSQPVIKETQAERQPPIIRAMEYVTRGNKGPLSGLIPIESGVTNLAVAFYTSAVTGIPVIDADPAGRSVPECTQLTYALDELPVGLTTCAPDGDAYAEEVIVLHGLRDDKRVEDVLRALCGTTGNLLSLVTHVLRAHVVTPSLIKGTVSGARKLGRAWRKAKEAADKGKKSEDSEVGFEVVKKVIEKGNGRVLFSGNVYENKFKEEGGFSRGFFITQYEDKKMKIDFINENMSITDIQSGTVVASIPEIISVFDRKSGEIIFNPDVAEGTDIVVTILPAPPPYLTEKGLAALGPKYLNLDAPFRSALN